jgi:hypothetical protein
VVRQSNDGVRVRLTETPVVVFEPRNGDCLIPGDDIGTHQEGERDRHQTATSWSPSSAIAPAGLSYGAGAAPWVVCDCAAMRKAEAVVGGAASRERIARVPPASDAGTLDLECSKMRGLQASPDGSQAAIVYQSSRVSRTGDRPEVRLAVINLPGGSVGHDQLLGNNIDCRAGSCPPDARPADYQGMAWDDTSTLRVAMEDLAVPFGDIVVERIPVG